MFKIFAVLESVRNLLQNPYNNTNLTLGMLLHYTGKLKIQILCRYGRKCKQIAFCVCQMKRPRTFLSLKNTKSEAEAYSALHESSTVRVCQLLCTTPLETFQIQVFTNDLGQRRPMNTHLP